MALLILLTLALSVNVRSSTGTLLFNGNQNLLFEDASSACLAAFDTDLNCDVNIQLLSSDMDKLDFNQSQLTSLCTASCKTSLSTLNSSVSSECGDYDFDFNDDYLSAVQVVDLYTYKYDMICLTDSSTGDFCVMVEETWDITALDNSSQATWPAYTNKTFPDWYDDNNGIPAQDVDGTYIDNSNEMPTFYDVLSGLDTDWSASDYYFDGIDANWTGHGWPDMLEYDEYPLEIQCSECFSQYKLGLESQWGEIYDEVSSQVWNNIKANCALDWDLAPANNLSTGVLSGIGSLVWKASPTCEQNITFSGSTDNATTCNNLALQYGVPSSALIQMNDVYCNKVSNSTLCLPLSCNVAVVNATINPYSFIDQYDNITYTQFVAWNTYINHRTLLEGAVVCVGPPGGVYIPATTTTAVANPTVYTTTATPTDPTASGTIENCGKYVEAQTGDYCNTIVLAAGITLESFVAMNPSIDANCTNLLAGLDYCVALVNGTSIANTTASAYLSTAASTGITTTATTTSTFVAAPTQTVTGTTDECYEWYVVESGDSCYSIYSNPDYDLTFEEFRELNTYIDEVCDNLWPDYAYCVSGIAEAPSSTIASVMATATG